MADIKEKEQKWILEHLQLCGYRVEDVTWLCQEEIEGIYERLYLTKLTFSGKQVERIVFKHGECLDMISKNIQVIDMLGKSDNVIFPRSKGKSVQLSERHPIMEDDITPHTVLFYEDYVSLREHFFKGNRLIQVACWVRTDNYHPSLNYGKYGHYVLTVNINNEDTAV